MSGSEKSSWEKTGDLPERVTISKGTKSDDTAASSAAPRMEAGSSPAEPVEQAAGTPANDAPASAPGTPAKGKGAKARNAELDAEITGLQERLRVRAALREELARSERPSTPDARPGSSPDKPTTQAEYKRYLASPDAPNIEDFHGENGLAEWTAAMGVFIADARWADHQGRARQDAQFHAEIGSVQHVGKEASTRIQTYAEQHPDFAEKVSPGLLALPTASIRRLQGEKVGPQHVLAEEILKSPAIAQLFEHFSTPAGQAEWADLCRKPFGDLMRGFERVESRFTGTAGPTAPPLKHVSSAPEPPTVLGNRASDTSDAVEAAIRRKDVGAYIREQNKRDLAALRG